MQHRLKVKACKIGIGQGKKWTDRCSECHCFDTITGPFIDSTISDGMDELLAQDTTYFTDFGAICDRAGFNDEGFCKTESIAWMEALLEYIGSKSKNEVERSSWSEKRKNMVSVCEALFSYNIGICKKKLQPFVGHFTLRDAIHKWRMEFKLLNSHGVLTVESDWGAGSLVCLKS